MWAGQAVDPLQQLGGVWVSSLGCDVRPEDSLLVRRSKSTACLCFLAEGNGEICLDQRRVTVTGGDLLWYPAGVEVTQTPAPADPWTFYWVALDGPLTQALAEEFGWSIARMPIRLGAEARFVALFDEMLEAIFIEPYGRLLVSAYAYHLLVHLGQLTLGAPDISLAATRASITEIIAYLGRHLHEPLTLDGLAAHFYLSRSQLVRRFHLATGVPPMQYLNQLRIDRARALLFTDCPVGEIARLVGIHDVNYFYRLFKQITGTTPKKYREQFAHL
jgi:AraC-like DNA-binding protein